MTEDKGKVELESVKKRARIAGGIGLIILLFGAVAMLFGVLTLTDMMVPDNEHITDQNMPIRDLGNATYTWTADEIADMAQDKLDFLLVGGVVAGIGMAIFYTAGAIEPSKKKLHEIGCKRWEVSMSENVNYCPECGLDLKTGKGE